MWTRQTVGGAAGIAVRLSQKVFIGWHEKLEKNSEPRRFRGLGVGRFVWKCEGVG